MGCTNSVNDPSSLESLRSLGPLEVWHSRRSPILSHKGICTSSQPLASAIGSQILSKGGSAADAAVAMAAALNVLEPCSTGIGGDAFVLYYDAKTKEVHCLQGNGATSAKFSLELLNKRGIGIGKNMKSLGVRSGLCVTVPGAAMLWEDTLKKFGRLTLKEVLAPAIRLAKEGAPITPVTSHQWTYTHNFLQGDEALRVFKPNGSFPKPGDIFKNPDLAKTFESIAEKGAKEGFYRGRIANAIVEAVKEFDGVLDLEDLDHHSTACEKPISKVFRGFRIYETPPPTHGLAVLIALAILEKVCPQTEKAQEARADIEDTHKMLECMRLAMADTLHFVCDPLHNNVPVEALLNDAYISERAKLIREKAIKIDKGDVSPFINSDTCYFCCIDKDSNGCSMINSNYLGFGTGISPKGTGFTLQNRGHNFSLDPKHPNAVAPRKRPYHTIIPGLITKESDASLFAVFGNMGGFMQPQGHMQLIKNLIDHKMNPQAAIDARRWYICGPGTNQAASDVEKSVIKLEDGYGDTYDSYGAASQTSNDGTKKMIDGLRSKGHVVEDIVTSFDRELFGRAQVIIRNNQTGVLCAGSDPRCDGCAVPAL